MTVFTAALALAGQPTRAAAQHHGGGGHATPRGGAGASHGGYGHGGYGGYSGHYGYTGHGYYGRGYYGRGYYGGYYAYPYYPYYPYPYYPYYPYGSISLSFGWPYAHFGWSGSVSVGLGHHGGPAYAADDRGPMEPPPDQDSQEEPAREERGRVRLSVTPDDAAVYVDDEFRGSAREIRTITLSAGRHTIEATRPGFAPVRRQVTVAGGETSPMVVQLPSP